MMDAALPELPGAGGAIPALPPALPSTTGGALLSELVE